MNGSLLTVGRLCDLRFADWADVLFGPHGFHELRNELQKTLELFERFHFLQFRRSRNFNPEY